MKLSEILTIILGSIFSYMIIIIVVIIVVKKNRKNKIGSNNTNTKNNEQQEKQKQQQEHILDEEEEKWIKIVYNYYKFVEELKITKDPIISLNEYRNIVEKYKNQEIITNNNSVIDNIEYIYFQKYNIMKVQFKEIINDFKDFIREKFKKNQNISVKDAIWEKIEIHQITGDRSHLKTFEDYANFKNRTVDEYIQAYNEAFKFAMEEVLKEQSNSVLGGFIKFIKKINKKNKQTRKSKNNKSRNNKKSKK